MHEECVTDISDIALTFPSLPAGTVHRDNILHTIDQIFDRNYDVVLLDGAPESGKTVVLAQFCVRHRRNSFSLFLRPASELAYDSAYCRYDLSSQIAWHLTGKSHADNQYPSAAEYLDLLHRLSTDGRRARRYSYFVIDGLADIPRAAAGARAALLNQLPFGLPYIRFLITGNLESIPELKDRKVRCREQQISPFSVEEATTLFAGTLEPKSISDLHRRFSTTPGILASLRRTLEHRADAALVIESVGESKESVFLAEWKQNPPVSTPVKFALAAIAYVPTASDIPTLAIVAECETAELTSALLKLPYVLVDEHRAVASFAAEEFRHLAKSELAHLEPEVLRRFVAAYSARPLDARVVHVLPELLERQGDSRAYLNFLSRENLVSIFSNTNSLLSLLARLKSGQSTAGDSLNHELATQFSLDRSAVRSLLESGFPTSQIDATLRLSGSDAAARIANAQMAVEDRLHALSLVVKYQKQHGVVEPTLVAEVTRLCQLVQPFELEERAIEIASVILHFDTSLAFDLLKRSTKAGDGANGLDQAIASLSVRSFLSGSEANSTARALRSMLESTQVDRVEQFSALIGLFADAQDVSSLLAEVARLTDTSEKLAVLQQWIRRN